MKKPFYKKWWFIVIAVIFVLAVIGNMNKDTDTDKATGEESKVGVVTETNEKKATEKEVEVAKEEVEEVGVVAKEETKEEPKEQSVPREFSAALKKAETYAQVMHMSKAGIYDQLTSEYGENFPVEAAQYAIDNIVHDWKENALQKARSYANSMNMSNAAIYDQLISDYGEQFTPEEAQYAVDNL